MSEKLAVNNATCKHCGKPIMRFDFQEGGQWWHTCFIEGQSYLRCGVTHGKKAKPAK